METFESLLREWLRNPDVEINKKDLIDFSNQTLIGTENEISKKSDFEKFFERKSFFRTKS